MQKHLLKRGIKTPPLKKGIAVLFLYTAGGFVFGHISPIFLWGWLASEDQLLGKEKTGHADTAEFLYLDF
jgi:hypothetical protein